MQIFNKVWYTLDAVASGFVSLLAVVGVIAFFWGLIRLALGYGA